MPAFINYLCTILRNEKLLIALTSAKSVVSLVTSKALCFSLEQEAEEKKKSKLKHDEGRKLSETRKWEEI